MLAADKLQLQSALKQQATALKEKEFNLHHSNFMTVGTQAAVLAGLDITMFIEFNPPDDQIWGENLSLLPRMIKFAYYITIVSAFCANMTVVSHTTALSVLGAGMALRGPDGSMMTATDGLYEERKSVFFSFGLGMACTVGSVILSVWLLLRWEAALVCMILTLITCRTIWQNYVRVHQRFLFDESETVDFRDIMEGPANIQGVSFNKYTHSNNNNNYHNARGNNGNSLSKSRLAPSSTGSNRNDYKDRSQGCLRKSASLPVHDPDEESDRLLTPKNYSSNEEHTMDMEDIELQQTNNFATGSSRRRISSRTQNSPESPRPKGPYIHHM